MNRRNFTKTTGAGILASGGASAFLASAPAVPVVIAHRGASAVAPENTAAAIKEAIRMGAKVIEFDVRGTVDGGLVLFHDEDLERVAGKEGSIESMTLQAAKDLEVGSWFGKGAFAGEQVMELSKAIELCLEGGAIPLIERKTGDAAVYAEVIRSLEVQQNVIVQSFDWKFLEAFRAQIPETPIGALGSKDLSAEKLDQIEALHPEWVGWKFSDMNAEALKKLQEMGCQVALWTVNDPEVADRWLKEGVGGIISDYPDKMLPLLEK